MKQHFLLLALLGGTATAAQAQSAIAAGTIALGGSIGYSSSTAKTSASAANTTISEETKRSQFSLSPSVGFFLADNLAIGLNFSYQAYSNAGSAYRTTSPGTNRAELDPATVIRVGPYVQYYKMLSDQFGVLGTLSGGYQSTKDSQYSGNGNSAVVQELKASGLYAGLTPGVIFFPIPKFGISAAVGGLSYNRLNYDYPTNAGTTPNNFEDTSNEFGLKFGLDQLQFGGTYYFGR
jgi:hypothetical protein